MIKTQAEAVQITYLFSQLGDLILLDRFHISHLLSYCCQDKWESHANTSNSFELFEHVSLMTLDSIMKCAFSHDSHCQTERSVYRNFLLFPPLMISCSTTYFQLLPLLRIMSGRNLFNGQMLHSHCSGTNAYIKAVYELSDLINLRFRTFPYHNDLIFYLSPHGFRYRKACKVAHSHTGKTI